MSEVVIHKVDEHGHRTLPIWDKIAKRVGHVRQRAYELFETRLSGAERALDDWVKAEHELFGWPAAEMSEHADGYELHVRIPGIEASQVHVTAAPAEIIIQAAREPGRPPGGPIVLWSEFGPPQVYRRFELPGPIDTDKVSANLEKGTLTIIIPKGEPGRAQETTVAAA